ncbi:MAG: enoyl-CoA hydratase/isomerase family protein [Deltaproteobacteria bacterium]|nr:enoyl-CoA hydratase/isomerase family protein [Deltaproteobacteria bacterium]MBW1977911.1 enoyl-CoA hydratase/isomerase family protein [Deltaproteobacteria bacterium]MBW2046357.1 enoyl-CoA hydratase/isomerase family protein [Deltaproteobacteria bacterium]MBW2301409.1 enoyl-CoA hydratase/isomerase family protein [Deltaproteobacteria bacterium]
MSYTIRKAMVIGAGIMGRGIAAHLANANIPVYLLDIVPDELRDEEKRKGLTLKSIQVRNRISNQAIRLIAGSEPPALVTPGKLELIMPGNIEDDLHLAREVDWVIEAVVEDLNVKKRIMARLDEMSGKDTIVSTNTSGIPVNLIAQGRSENFKKHFLGTHFFNPARYMKLLELIPLAQTESQVLEFVETLGRRRLGKTVISCKDTPCFIANRVAIVAGQADLNFAIDNGYTVEEVDALSGPLIGRPKTATFRLFDLVGADITLQVSSTLYNAIPHDPFREVLVGSGSRIIKTLVEKGLLGTKAGQGFYRKTGHAGANATYQVLDFVSFEYREKSDTETDTLREAKKIKSLVERIKFLISTPDRAGKYVWHTLAFLFSYCSHVIPEIADSLYLIDYAFKAGFSHEMGPFEIWDALGVEKTALRMEKDGLSPANWVWEMLEEGRKSFYKKKGRQRFFWDPIRRSDEKLPVDPHVLVIADRKRKPWVIEENASASLVDLGDGVLCLEFHSDANLVDEDTRSVLAVGLKRLDEDFEGLVIGNQGKNFSSGSDLKTMLEAAQNGQWKLIEKKLQSMQNQILRLRYSSKPVVAAPFGMTLGGGAQIAMAADLICASAETYMGLVEAGIGLIPAETGCSMLIQRLLSPIMRTANTDPLPALQKAFENIAMAKVSTSAHHAQEMGFLKSADKIVMNEEHLLGEAKRMVIEMCSSVYIPQVPSKCVYAVGERGMAFLMQAVQTLLWAGYISEHDALIGKKLAYVLAGGPLSSPQWVDERHILDLEREAFLSLLGQRKTIDRIKHFAATGKILRN